MLTAMVPSSSKVVAAFLDFGFLKFGTPLLIASTPVSAAHPDEKVRASSMTTTNPMNGSYSGGPTTV